MRNRILIGGIVLFILGAVILAVSQTESIYSSEDCPYCEGTGKLGIWPDEEWPDEEMCHECGGSGMISPQGYAASGGWFIIGGALAFLGIVLIIIGAVLSVQQTPPPQHHGLPHQYPTQEQTVKYEETPNPKHHGLPHQYKQQGHCPHCGGPIKWDDKNGKYYCSRCQMFV